MVRSLLIFLTFSTTSCWYCNLVDAQQTFRPRNQANSQNKIQGVSKDSNPYWKKNSRSKSLVQKKQRKRPVEKKTKPLPPQEQTVSQQMHPVPEQEFRLPQQVQPVSEQVQPLPLQQQSPINSFIDSNFEKFVEPVFEEREFHRASFVQESKVESQTLPQWPAKPMSALRLDPRSTTTNNIPVDQADRLISQYSRDWNSLAVTEKPFNWEAPNVRYQPLYFEDVDLERYGHVVRNDYFQSIVSFAHFFSSAALLPLHMRHDPVYSCDYPLGYCRPGNCSNQIFQRPFWSRIPKRRR